MKHLKMKITKYAQSCILIETQGKRILIDPGHLEYSEATLNHWKNIDILLVTHKHGDHCHVPAIQEVLKKPKIEFYTSQEVADKYPELMPKIVKEKDVIKTKNLRIDVVKAVHGYLPFLKGGNEVRQNLGYIIDDGITKVYLTSDTISFENNYKCDIIFVPVCNHGLVMGPYEAALFAKETGAKLVIPIHYDTPKFPTDMDKVKEEFKKQGVNYKILGIGESFEI